MNANWMIMFMKDVSGTIVYIETNVDEDDIMEFGAEATTGVIKSMNASTIEQISIPELYTIAQAAAAMPKSTSGERAARNAAWNEVEKLANQMANEIKWDK